MHRGPGSEKIELQQRLVSGVEGNPAPTECSADLFRTDSGLDGPSAEFILQAVPFGEGDRNQHFAHRPEMADRRAGSRKDKMEAIPILAIITPVYNGEKFISGCIESVVAQTLSGIEHIIVDGGSSDRTVDILRDKARLHPHLRWISEPDRGQSDAVNKGIDMARAEYIGILNADDFYEPGALRCVAAIMKNLSRPRLIVGACNMLTIGDQIQYVNRPSVLKFENLMIDPWEWPFPYNPSAYFYPKAVHDVVGPYNIEEHFGMDFEFILAAVRAIEPLYLDAVLGNFRLLPGTKTFEKNAIDGSMRLLLRKIRIRAWRRAPFQTKMRIVFLYVLHKLKVECCNLSRRRWSIFMRTHDRATRW